MDSQYAFVGEVDVASRTVHAISGDWAAPRASVLVRDGAHTLGYAYLEGTADLVERAIAAIGEVTTSRAWSDGAGAELRASVVLCTLGSNALLKDAVDAVLAQDHPNFELVVVDNNPASGDIQRQLAGISDSRLRIVREPRRGLSHARNTGVAHSTGDIVAFTDDDATTDPTWLSALLAVFGSDRNCRIGAVTGPAFPAELKFPSQRFFESRGGFPKTTVPTVWALPDREAEVATWGALGEGGPLFPFATARVGAGVSMAFRRSVLEKIGEFDIALGAGTPTNGGEDLDAFARVLVAGYAIVTNPDAVVHHVHRQDVAGLTKQCFGNGTGMAALLTKTILRNPLALIALAARIPQVARRLAPGSARVAGSDSDVPGELTKAEIRGFLCGPWFYVRQLSRQWRTWR